MRQRHGRAQSRWIARYKPAGKKSPPRLRAAARAGSRAPRTNPTAGGACVFRCWIALDDLKIGAKIRDAIDEEIRIRDKLIVIMSEAAIRSDWVKAEVSKAFAKERGRNKAHAEQRERKKTVLFPIRIDDAAGTTSEPWARRLRDEYNIWDFRSWPEPAAYQKNLNRLLRDLKTNETK